jgi:hypothetical protein
VKGKGQAKLKQASEDGGGASVSRPKGEINPTKPYMGRLKISKPKDKVFIS